MRLHQPRTVVSIALASIVPLVVLGILVVQRLGSLNEERYEQEVVAAHYAVELTAEQIFDGLRDELNPWREALVYAHGRGEASFRAKLQKMFLTSPLVDVPQFVDEDAILAGAWEGIDGHRCDKAVAFTLRAALIEEGRWRGEYDEKKGVLTSTLEDDTGENDWTPLRWLHVDLEGPYVGGCPGCESELAAIGVPIAESKVAVLTLSFPLPGGVDTRPGLFGAIVPAPALLREIVAPALARWTDEGDALPRHGLRLVDGEGQLILPDTEATHTAGPLRDAKALTSSAILGERAPWRVEVVALSGFDVRRLRAENGRWAFAIGLAAVVLALGALVFSRSFLHQVETDRLRRHLISNVGHELKTPLSLIRLYTETLESGRARSDEERAKFLSIVGREAKRLTHLIDNLLDVQRIEEDRKQYGFAQVRPERVVRDTVEAYRFRLTEEGFDVRLDVDDDLPLLFLDGEAIAQALINLLDNAAKYSDTTREIAVRVAHRSDAVAISVQDRGIGIPTREQDKIFQSFYRVEKSDVHDVKGSGLGLAVVAHVAQAHGGRVDVDSTPGRGSTFTLVLPIGFEPS